MRTDEDDRVIDSALATGGAFEKAIARAAIVADSDNLWRLRNAFPLIWKKHGSINRVKKKTP